MTYSGPSSHFFVNFGNPVLSLERVKLFKFDTPIDHGKN